MSTRDWHQAFDMIWDSLEVDAYRQTGQNLSHGPDSVVYNLIKMVLQDQVVVEVKSPIYQDFRSRIFSRDPR